MSTYCIAWKLQKARGGGIHTGPRLIHPEYASLFIKGRLGFIGPPNKTAGKPLTKEEAEAKAQRMNLAEEFPSHHYAIRYKGREWNEINQKSTQTGQRVG